MNKIIIEIILLYYLFIIFYIILRMYNICYMPNKFLRYLMNIEQYNIFKKKIVLVLLWN